MKCPYCHQIHPDQVEFCPVTGQAFPPKTELSRCPKCENLVKVDGHFCPYCGYLLGEPIDFPTQKKKFIGTISIVFGLIIVLLGVWLFTQDIYFWSIFSFFSDESTMTVEQSVMITSSSEKTITPEDKSNGITIEPTIAKITVVNSPFPELTNTLTLILLTLELIDIVISIIGTPVISPRTSSYL